MNDNDFEMIEEFQSDSMDELVSERKKNKAIQSFLMQSSFPVKYSLVENYPNGDSFKSEIAPEYLDELAENKKDSFSAQKHRSDSLFYATIPMVLNYEGGYVNDKFDRGGETNMGITQPFLDTYKKKAGVNIDNVKNLTKSDAIKLYKAEWDSRGFGLLDNENVMKLIYDFSVNSGPSTAIRSLQKALNKIGYNLKEDGYIGDKTNQAVNSVDEKWLKKELLKSRAEHCDAIIDKHPEQKRYIEGWFYRINDIGNKFGCDTIFKSRHLKK
ncbi:MAG: hypothetical protein J6J37_06655 [Bacteroidaceae bacterium]|nr:hypothetical protein [Bacteroidaceae bacterium]